MLNEVVETSDERAGETRCSPVCDDIVPVFESRVGTDAAREVLTSTASRYYTLAYVQINWSPVRIRIIQNADTQPSDQRQYQPMLLKNNRQGVRPVRG